LGELDTAESLLEEVLHGDIIQHGPNHPDVLSAKHQLAKVRREKEVQTLSRLQQENGDQSQLPSGANG
jgi:hypothetical protein